MSIRAHLNRLVLGFSLALACVCLAGVGGAGMTRSRLQVVKLQSAPIQNATSEFSRQLEHLTVLLVGMPQVRSHQELATVEQELQSNLADLQATSEQLRRLDAGDQQAVIAQVGEAARQLPVIIRDRLAGAQRQAVQHREMTAAVDQVITLSDALGSTLGSTRKEAEGRLSTAADAAIAANGRIKRILDLRERVAKAMSLVHQVLTVDQRRRLAAFSDRFQAVVDGIRSQAEGDDELVQTFADLTRNLLAEAQDDAGLIALRGRVLATPSDEVLVKSLAERARQTTSQLDALGVGLLEKADRLEQEVATARSGMLEAIRKSARATDAATLAGESAAQARTLSARTAAINEADTDQELAVAKAGIEQAFIDLSRVLTTLKPTLTDLALADQAAHLTTLEQRLATLHGAVVGNDGSIALVAARLAGERQFAAVQTKLHQELSVQITRAGADAAGAAAEQRGILDRLVRDASWTLVLMPIFGGATLLTAWWFARRVARAVLAAEAADRAHGAALAQVVDHVRRDVEALTGSSRDLAETSRLLTNLSRTAGSEADGAAVAGATIADQVESVAGSATQVESGMEVVRGNADRAAQAAIGAAELVQRASAIMERLGASSEEIVGITQTINEIAEQTNLLALNATIEAASAGEAGRGFAVVAGEVKNLSRETASANATIARLVGAVREQVQLAVEGMAAVSGAVADIRQQQTAIVDAVHGQSETSQAMVRQLGDAATGVRGIAGTIRQVAEASTRTIDQSNQLDRLSANLATLAEGLGRLVQQRR